MNRLALMVVASCTFVTAGCEQKPAAPPAGSGSGDAAKPSLTSPEKPAAESDEHGHEHANDGTKASGGHGGEVMELGTAKIGDLTVRASRDKGEIRPGGDAPIDVWVTTADGKPAMVTAVRFWIGTEDAKASVKAKADVEDPNQRIHWHAHAEVPDPLPDGSKLWVEIETGAGKTVGSFDLKR